jgi:hypothetical protein
VPYSGITPGSELEKKIETCVKDVMSQHEGEDNFEKSNAVAICRASIEKKDEQKAEGGVELFPVTSQEMENLPNLFYGSEADKTELLKFESALLCQVGTNANNDAIDERGVEDLADTLKWMPILDEHSNKVVGFVLESKVRNKSTELRGSGVIFASRFPDVVNDIRSGKKRISIEAVAEKARCGECNEVFASPKDYCLHLRSKAATRWLSGLKARGIATVEHPAWETSFGDANSFVMIASEIDCGCDTKKVEVTVKEPTWIQELKAWVENKLKPVVEEVATVTLDEIGGKKMADFEIVDGETLEGFKTRLGLVAASELEAREVELKDAFEVREAELKSEFESREVELKAETDKVRVGFERALELGMNSEQAEILASLAEDAYALFKQQQKEVKLEASDKEEEPKPGQLQGQVLSTTEVVDKPLSLEGMGDFLSGRLNKKEVK